MKQYSITISKHLLAAILVLFFSCSKDNMDSPLVGTWQGLSYIASEPVDENGDGEAHADLSEEMDCVLIEAEFTSQGNFLLTSSDATYDVQIIAGKVVLVPTGCTSTSENGSWTLNETSDVLHLQFEIAGNDEPYLMDIQIELSQQQLIMKDLPYNDDGSITYTVKFEKV
ncbi:MAG TPA: hypothetical protein PK335_03935 [Draconibacterium sp.]|nr:hypothetical protein [Draconibacterium sp.]